MLDLKDFTYYKHLIKRDSGKSVENFDIKKHKNQRNLLSNQVEPNFDESYEYRNPKLFQSQRFLSPTKESEEKDIPTEKNKQVINGIISDITFGALEAQ